MKAIRVRISFDRPYRLNDDQAHDIPAEIESLTRLWKGYLGPGVENLKVELVEKEIS